MLSNGEESRLQDINGVVLQMEHDTTTDRHDTTGGA